MVEAKRLPRRNDTIKATTVELDKVLRNILDMKGACLPISALCGATLKVTLKDNHMSRNRCLSMWSHEYLVKHSIISWDEMVKNTATMLVWDLYKTEPLECMHFLTPPSDLLDIILEVELYRGTNIIRKSTYYPILWLYNCEVAEVEDFCLRCRRQHWVYPPYGENESVTASNVADSQTNAENND